MIEPSLDERRAIKRTEYEATATQLDFILAARECTVARAALWYTATVHTGLRKDQVTPEHMHMVTIAMRMLSHANDLVDAGIRLDRLIGIILLHDTHEDHLDIHKKDIRHGLLGVARDNGWTVSAKSCVAVARDSVAMSKKKNDGTRKPVDRFETTEAYYRSLADDPYLLLCKLGDKEHNMDTVQYLCERKQARCCEEAALLCSIAREKREKFPQIANVIDDYIDRIEHHIAVNRHPGRHACAPAPGAATMALLAAKQ